jgi:hypothetical protein
MKLYEVTVSLIQVPLQFYGFAHFVDTLPSKALSLNLLLLILSTDYQKTARLLRTSTAEKAYKLKPLS